MPADFVILVMYTRVGRERSGEEGVCTRGGGCVHQGRRVCAPGEEGVCIRGGGCVHQGRVCVLKVCRGVSREVTVCQRGLC